MGRFGFWGGEGLGSTSELLAKFLTSIWGKDFIKPTGAGGRIFASDNFDNISMR